MFAVVLGLSLVHLFGIDYGTFDARALPWAVLVMPVGDTSQAQYYNPALLAFHSGDRRKTNDGIYFPTFNSASSDTVESAVDAVDDELDTTLSNA